MPCLVVRRKAGAAQSDPAEGRIVPTCPLRDRTLRLSTPLSRRSTLIVNPLVTCCVTPYERCWPNSPRAHLADRWRYASHLTVQFSVFPALDTRAVPRPTS